MIIFKAQRSGEKLNSITFFSIAHPHNTIDKLKTQNMYSKCMSRTEQNALQDESDESVLSLNEMKVK